MNYILLLPLFLFSSLLSYSQENDASNLSHFYDFDSVVHYNIDHEPTLSPYELPLHSKKDSIWADSVSRLNTIILSSFANTNLITLEADLLSSGFDQRFLNDDACEELHSLFKQRSVDYSVKKKCFAKYRDVLILFLDGENVGMVKICFECGMYDFYGSKVSTSSFFAYEQDVALKNILFPE